VDEKTALSQSGDNPEFQAVVSKAVDLLAAKNKVVPLTKLVEGPELSLGTPVEFEVQNEVTTTAATHEEEKSSALDTDPSRTTESDEDSQQEQNPELNAPRSRNIIADVIDGNREENIARRKAERAAAFDLWKKANPDAANIADSDRAIKIADIEEEKIKKRNLGIVDRDGVAEHIDAARKEKSSELKGTGERNWGSRLKKTGTKFDENGNIIKPQNQI
jgi:hypothetical protein